jgi:polysaccharide lyase-like protein
MLAACVLFGATACGRHVYLGGLGDGGSGILWQATFETGDLTEWLSDGKGGVYMDNLAGAPAASQDQAHRGGYSGIASFAPLTVTSFSYLFREQPSPPEAYYGAWFFIPASLQVRSWLSLHHFGYHRSAGVAETTPLWDFNVYPGSDGNLIAHVYDATAMANIDQTSPIPVPMAAWVHFEIFFRKAADATGRITIWQDGVQILDHANVVTAPTDLIQWDAGGGSNDIAPSPAAVYFDDATISLTRVGVGQ